MVRLCCLCLDNRAIIKRPKTAEMVCKDCFFRVFEDEVHQTIVDNCLFHHGERVAIAASGGKGNEELLDFIQQDFFFFFLLCKSFLL
jgi:cytoplasmic tRNA 2-thiolation protein 1